MVAVIPAYNESKNIKDLINRVKKYVSLIIVVDDGSEDDTMKKALEADIKVLRNPRNRGKGYSLKRGLVEAMKFKPDMIVTIDADGQHDPDDIPNILKPIQDGSADMVIGSRFNTNTINEVPLIRGMGLSIINILNHMLTNINVKDTQSGFRAYSKTIFGTITDYSSGGYGAENQQLAQASMYGYNIIEVPVNIKYKELENTSKKNPVLHAAHLVSTILKIAVESRPLLFFGLSGLFLILISFAPLIKIMAIFNETRYFSIPLALIVLGLVFIGTMLIILSFILHALNMIRQKILSKKY